MTLSAHQAKPDWIIFGGESGPGFRPIHIGWAEGIKQECAQFKIAFHLKQMAAASTVSAKKLIPGHLMLREYPSTETPPT